MSMSISARQIQSEIQVAFDHIDSDVVALHTDLLRIGFFDEKHSSRQQKAAYLSRINDVSQDRTLLFPTFNYDFCRTGVYTPVSDPCQVGTLNEYVRKLYPDQRTLTPVFNFCICNNSSMSLEPVDNPFSAASTFGELARRGATIVFFGAVLPNANTFIHHVEEVMNIGYRYIKPFPGVIRTALGDRSIVLNYRVRPLTEGAAVYDWERLSSDLMNRNMLHGFPLGNGQLLFYRADRLLEYWCDCLHKDELYLLTFASRKKAEELYKQYGKPLRYELLEHPQLLE